MGIEECPNKTKEVCCLINKDSSRTNKFCYYFTEFLIIFVAAFVPDFIITLSYIPDKNDWWKESLASAFASSIAALVASICLYAYRGIISNEHLREQCCLAIARIFFLELIASVIGFIVGFGLDAGLEFAFQDHAPASEASLSGIGFAAARVSAKALFSKYVFFKCLNIRKSGSDVVRTDPTPLIQPINDPKA